jgi:hypothetical protein
LASSHLGIGVYIHFWGRSRYETDDYCSWQGNLIGPLSHNKNWYFSYLESREGEGVRKNFQLVSNLTFRPPNWTSAVQFAASLIQ